MLAKFTWAKEAQMKLEKMKEEGKPLPKSMAEVLVIAFQIAVLWHFFTFFLSFLQEPSFLECLKRLVHYLCLKTI